MRAFAEATGGFTPLAPVFPAVTCSVQASMLTGLSPGITDTGPASTTAHGIVGNGWYDRDRAEVRFWQRQRPAGARRENLGRRPTPKPDVHLR